MNPLNTDHTANLARLYSWWASVTSDATLRKQRADTASNYYATALTLSPQNSTLWGEWSILYTDIYHQPDQAYKFLTHAIDLDPLYDWTQGLMGDYYFKISQTITDTKTKNADLTQAIGHYQTALSLAKSSYDGTASTYLISLGNAYTSIGDLDQAINAYSQTLTLSLSQDSVWRIQETMARIYAQKGDKADAIVHANQALNEAPSDQKTRLQQFIAQLQAMP